MMLEKWFKGTNPEAEKKFQEIKLKHVELENQLVQNAAEIEQMKVILRDTQLSLQLILSSYQGLAEEVSTLYEAMRALMGSGPSKNSFSFCGVVMSVKSDLLDPELSKSIPDPGIFTIVSENLT